jgi:hypothetical protein
VASPRLSPGAIILLRIFVRSWDTGARCFIMGMRIHGRFSNHKDHQRASILCRAGYIEPWGSHQNSFRVTPAGIARHDYEALNELVDREKQRLQG